MKRKTYLWIAALVLLVMAVPKVLAVFQTREGIAQSVSGKEAKQIMEELDDYIILDVRTREEYESGHIPGAICLPNEEILSVQPEQLPDLNQHIFIYCRSGNRSRQAAKKLVDMGYQNVIDFGGIHSWDGPLEK